jgi:hypothetical protein
VVPLGNDSGTAIWTLRPSRMRAVPRDREATKRKEHEGQRYRDLGAKAIKEPSGTARHENMKDDSGTKDEASGTAIWALRPAQRYRDLTIKGDLGAKARTTGVAIQRYREVVAQRDATSRYRTTRSAHPRCLNRGDAASRWTRSTIS